MNSAPIESSRVYVLQEAPPKTGPVVYWMSRDQRAKDNWALLYARQQALAMQQPVVVVFCLVPRFLDAAWRQYAFMLQGLEQTHTQLKTLAIPFTILCGTPGDVLPEMLQRIQTGLLVTDFDPLRIKTEWTAQVLSHLDIPVHQVDAHNLVPCRVASSKQEYGAYTLRPKLHRLLPHYLTPFPNLSRHPYPLRSQLPPPEFSRIRQFPRVRSRIGPVSHIQPGSDQAEMVLAQFLSTRLPNYARMASDPNAHALSGLSPYLHFGQISAQRVALAVHASDAAAENKEAFLEELIVRRELADNYCFYNPEYDSLRHLPDWARKTLDEHRRDPRETVYSAQQFEQAETADPLWNAAQRQLVTQGRMHSYLRMYWAKKILEWSASPEEAMATAIILNDRYQLDGRDPNGYTGIAWSIGGIHDRAWPERPVFGKIRYMNANGCRRKFNVNQYIAHIEKETQ